MGNVCNVCANKPTEESHNSNISELYDASCELYEEVWGEHMHTGYFEVGKPPGDYRIAQLRMIDEVLAWIGVPDDEANRPHNILDVGCGFGATAQYLAKKYGANVKGVALSEYEIKRATVKATANNVSDKVTFEVADALKLPFPEGQFDLVWSMECAPHITDRVKLMEEMLRVVKPGGWVAVMTWCHRDLSPGETSLAPNEQIILNKVCNTFHFPPWCPPSEFRTVVEKVGMEDAKVEDWTRYMIPFWPEIAATTFTFKGLTSILKSGEAWVNFQVAFGMYNLGKGFKSGAFKYIVVKGKKPGVV